MLCLIGFICKKCHSELPILTLTPLKMINDSGHLFALPLSCYALCTVNALLQRMSFLNPHTSKTRNYLLQDLITSPALPQTKSGQPPPAPA